MLPRHVLWVRKWEDRAGKETVLLQRGSQNETEPHSQRKASFLILPLLCRCPQTDSIGGTWTITEHSQDRSSWQSLTKDYIPWDFEWQQWNPSSIWIPYLLDSTLNNEIEHSSEVCALALCLWAMVRWQREIWPESGALGLHLRSVTDTFLQPPKCVHHGLFISQDVSRCSEPTDKPSASVAGLDSRRRAAPRRGKNKTQGVETESRVWKACVFLLFSPVCQTKSF